MPALLFLILLGCFTATALPESPFSGFLASILFYLAALAYIGIIAAALWQLFNKGWAQGIVNMLLLFFCGWVTFYAFIFLMFASMFGPSEDGFADHLTIPDGIEIAEPDVDKRDGLGIPRTNGTDDFQHAIRAALAAPGGDETEFAQHLPSLRKASTEHAVTLREYIEASPDWHVTVEQGNHFAERRWSYDGEPQDTLHGYVSEFDGEAFFQTRCLICLDRKQWGNYPVQQVQEGQKLVKPKMARENELHESRVMIDCGGVWVEVFEQTSHPERRLTKATVAALEKEFATFVRDPAGAIAEARTRSRLLAARLAGEDDQPFRLISEFAGHYSVAYSLNPGEPGSVYLKAFEITHGTPLSVGRLEEASKARIQWSNDPSERFAAQAGFTIYEGDNGQFYAARFEVWFEPDSGKPERKIAERNFKIEGWQR